MKRRTFCGMALATGAAASIHGTRLLAAPADSGQLGAELRAVKLSGGETTLERAAVQDLRASLQGNLLVPGQDGYETARRIWNGMIDRRPALIARCRNTADVVRAVTFARERELLLAVRGGGHSFPGYSTCDGGLVIDLSPVNSVQVDETRRTAKVGGGAWVFHVDTAAQRHDLATTLGEISNTGVGGLTLGGGFGWLARRFGLACDNLLSAELVTADGAIRRVSKLDEPDLFWAIRGGGGNFGVATSFEYQLHPVSPSVIAGHVDYPEPQIRDVLRLYADMLAHAPRELSLDLSIAPDAKGDQSAQIYAVYTGTAAGADKALQPLKTFGKPTRNTIAATTYLTAQAQFDGPPLDPANNYLKGGFVRQFPTGLIDVLTRELHAQNRMSVYIQNANGAVADITKSATAFSHRDAMANLMLSGRWTDATYNEQGRTLIRSTWEKLAPFTDGYYVNLNDVDPKGVDSNYGQNFQRLATLKKKVDPLNLFRLNANIRA